MAATKDYSAIAKRKIVKPSSSSRMPRYLVYGRQKKGKTRFCCTAPNVLVLDPEEGTKYETKLNPDVWPITQWEDMHEAYEFLKGGSHSYEWVAIDGLTKITTMALKWVTKRALERELDRPPEMIKIQDYGRSNEQIKQMLHNFHSLGKIGMVITCQERMIVVEGPGEEDEDAEDATSMFVPDLPKGARSAVNSVVDVIGRIYMVKGDIQKKFKQADGKIVTRTIEGTQRRLWVGPHVSYDTGYRSEFTLPDMLADPTVTRLNHLIVEGKV